MGDAAFEIYLASLIASWDALAAPQAGATVTHGPGYVAARFDEPDLSVLNNAVILAPAAIGAAAGTYDPGQPYALWCRDDDREFAASLSDLGYGPSETTRPMLCLLESLPAGDTAASVLIDADTDRVADTLEVPRRLLRGVAGLRAYASDGYESALILQRTATDVYASMVFTRPEQRRRGLAAATLTAALLDARARGAVTASLQSTPMAESMYVRHGFQPVGRWQEWVRENPQAQSGQRPP